VFDINDARFNDEEQTKGHVYIRAVEVTNCVKTVIATTTTTTTTTKKCKNSSTKLTTKCSAVKASLMPVCLTENTEAQLILEGLTGKAENTGPEK
jgi:hypothetical protein